MKKIRLTALLLLAVALVLTSCSATDRTDRSVLTVMGKKSDLEKSYMTDMFELYEESTDKKIRLIAYTDSEFEQKATEDFKNGNAPDVFLHFHNDDLNQFDVDDNFYYLGDESWVPDLTDDAKAYCSDQNGNLLGLPYWENSVSGCYYNKTILDSLGLKAASNQSEFDFLCQALADAGYTPICWPANGCAWMVQFGLDPIFADNPDLLEKINNGEIGFSDIPEVTNMVRWISDAAKKGWFGSDYLKTGWSEISDDMSSGKAVMTFIWDTWFYTDLAKDGKYGVDDFAVMPVFMNTADGGTYESGNLNMMMVNKNSDHLSMALDFLEFCATPENYNATFDGISTVSCFKGETTNIQSKMLTDAKDSIDAHRRAPIAVSLIEGYSGDSMTEAIEELLRGKTDVSGCVKMMDEKRLAAKENR